MSENIYRQFDENHECYMSDEYAAHTDRMTREELHSKSDIAMELAFRDIRIAEQEAQIAALESRVDFLMEGHLLIKSQTPSADPTADHTIALGLGESIMEHHPVQHTEQGTALFVEVRVLDAVRPEVKRIDCEGVGDNDGFFEITPADTGDQE